MRVLFTLQPWFGHYSELLPCARALRDAGHEVCFATAKSFLPTIAKDGFETVAAGMDWQALDVDKIFPGIESTWTPTNFSYENAFAGPTAEKMVPDLLAFARTWKPDVIVRESWEFGGGLVGEILGIPHATCGLNVFLPPSVWRQLVGPNIDANRAAFGLPPDPEMNQLYRLLDLAWNPPSFASPEGLSAVTHFLRPLPPKAEAAPEWVRTLAKPLVHVTFGTFVSRTTDLYDLTIAALGNENLSVIVGSGATDRAKFSNVPSNTRIEAWVSHPMLLPICDLVITHGGLNTVMATLRAGKPMLFLPFHGDQFHTARVCVECGVGLSLLDGARSVEAVRVAALELLSNPKYRLEAEKMSTELLTLPPASESVRLLSQLVATRAPVLRS